MLCYLTDLTEDSHDFGWQNDKGSDAVLCKMEDNKISWDETNKIYRVRRVHSQRVTNSNTQGQVKKSNYKKPHIAHIGQITKLVAKCMCTSVPTVTRKEKITSIPLKIVRLIKQTSKALQ